MLIIFCGLQTPSNYIYNFVVEIQRFKIQIGFIDIYKVFIHSKTTQLIEQNVNKYLKQGSVVYSERRNMRSRHGITTSLF